MTLQLVGDHVGQIKEAYRVLKPGSIASFAVWGRIENSNMFTIFFDVLAKIEFANHIEIPAIHGNFKLGSDLKKLHKDFLEAGFKEVKMWY